ncbi:MAG: MFS transporter [Alphaproteobacteria bacterium]|nr:MAG: MFS transporter [Alphaproteobacteria bacterium]
MHHLPTRDQFRFFHDLRVRWGEVDAQGVVFNPNYLVFADVAGTEYLRAIGAFGADVSDLFVANANVNFRQSARFDDELKIGVRVAYRGRTSLLFVIAMWRDDTLIADVALTYVRVDAETGKPAPPDAVVGMIESYEGRPLDVRRS